MSQMIKIEMPFQGFYGTIHEYELDSQLESFLEDKGLSYEDIAVDWVRVKLEYSQKYVDAFSDFLGDKFSSLTFSSLESPSEYNFHNDSIFCTIDSEVVRGFYEKLKNKQAFIQYIKEVLKPRSGFIPFYSNNINKWPPFNKLELPQRSLIISFIFEKALETAGETELSIMEDYFCNGGRCLVEDNTTLINEGE